MKQTEVVNQFLAGRRVVIAKFVAHRHKEVQNKAKKPVGVVNLYEVQCADGNPPPHSVKYFAASELLEQVEDRAWLAKITNALNQHWQKKNAAKQNCPANGSSNGHIRAEAGAGTAPATA